MQKWCINRNFFNIFIDRPFKTKEISHTSIQILFQLPLAISS